MTTEPVVRDPSDDLQAALRANLLAPESEAHAVHCYRLLRLGLRHAPEFRPASALEVGSYSHPGLALLLLLMGAEKITLNNIGPVRNHLGSVYVENLVALAAIQAENRRDFHRFVEPDGDGFRIRDQFLTLAGGTDAEDLSSRGLDFIYSFSVLEHMRRLPIILERFHAMMAPGGLMYHWIDVRDHTSFDDPLRYLRMDHDAFVMHYTPDNNRWRPSDYLRMLEKARFEIVSTSLYTQNPLTAGGSDLRWWLLESLEGHVAADMSEIAPTVTEKDRAALHSDFQSHSLAELSVIAFGVLTRRIG